MTVARIQVAVEGVRFAVDRVEARTPQTSTPALLLHGVPQTAAVWGPLVAELSADRLVLAPDLKGLGESEIRPPYDVPTLTHELAALVLHEVDGRVDVVGHDWGGTLAMALAALRPDLVRRVVVINAAYQHIDLTRAWHVPLFAVPVVPELAFALGGRAIVSRMLDYAWRADTRLDPQQREAYAAAYDDPRRVRAMLGYYRAIARPRALAPMRRLMGQDVAVQLPMPHPEAALVLWGAADPVLPLRLGEQIVSDIGPQARLVTLPGVGHWAVDEAPGLVTGEVAEFLRADEPAD
jgi:pimeloyl-ACP methyl ester carboxylesterase